MSDTMTVQEACRALGYGSVNTVYGLLRAGALRGEKVEGVWRIERHGVELRLERRRQLAERRA